MDGQRNFATTRQARPRLTLAATAGLVVIGAVLLIAIRPNWARDVTAALVRIDLGWLAAAFTAQVFSIGSLARQQRRLLTAGGSRLLPLPSVVATTYGGNALSQSLPIVGKAAAAVYSYRRFTARGLDPAIVGWALAMSALHLILAFSTVGIIGAFAAATPGAITAGVFTTAGILLPAFIGLAALRNPRIRHRIDGAIGRVFTLLRHAIRRPWPRGEQRLRTAVQIIATTRLGARNTVIVIVWSLLTMTASLTALALSILAVGGTATWAAITVTWTAAFGAGQLGITPGGIGIVDTALTIGLVATGIPTATAIAATLVYRIISFWITAGIGGIALALTTRTKKRGHSGATDCQPVGQQ